MHSNFWKYFAIISVSVTCVVVISTWMFWFFGSTKSETKNELRTEEMVEEILKSEENVVVVPENPRLRILAAGDIMLDRTMFLLAQRHNDFGYSFRMISSTLQQADLRVVNLEGPITTNKSTANIVNGGRGLNFTFSPKVTTTLKENFDVVSLANNHTTNFGFEGLEQTKKFLDEAGIGWFGDPNNRATQKLSVIVEKNGFKIGFVGHHQLIEQGFENVIEEIKRIRPEVDMLIAYPHWGHEYVTSTPSVLQKEEAYAMIDAGVDLIIGAHPHVIQPVELYNDRIIFYSLGNFVFDQYFSLETMQGLLLSLVLEKDTENLTTQISLIPVHINKQSQPFVADTLERESVLSLVGQASIGDENFRKSVTNGMISFTIPVQKNTSLVPMK
ncbi:MAG: CapA family protein [Candidatus Magasanikbacteria bacterium]|nr:CapA family protein [Candidatus Magasanikbacteria bacterium]